DTTTEFRPDRGLNTTAEFRKPRRRGRWLAVAAALLALLAGVGAVIYVETDYGQIVVQLNDPNAKVDVKVNGQEVTLAVEGGKPIRVRAGKNQKLEISGAEFETVSDTFDLKRGDVHVARVTLKLKPEFAKKNPPDPVPHPNPKVDPKKDPVVVDP